MWQFCFFNRASKPPGAQRAQPSRGREDHRNIAQASQYTELLMADRTEHLRPWLYLVLVAGLNAYICQEAFLTESTGHWQSMHGAWMAMARIIGLDWLPPRWWPYWGGGAPVQYAYAPLIPAATAVMARILRISIPMAFHALTGLVYCLGPVLLYVASWRMFRADFAG
jgi:hypothetical protein